MILVQRDTVFVVEPLKFIFFKLEIGMNIKACMVNPNSISKKLNVDLDSLAASFNEPSLTFECDLFHEQDTSGDNYIDVTTIESVLWLFRTAGFYGLMPHGFMYCYIYEKSGVSTNATAKTPPRYLVWSHETAV